MENVSKKRKIVHSVTNQKIKIRQNIEENRKVTKINRLRKKIHGIKPEGVYETRRSRELKNIQQRMLRTALIRNIYKEQMEFYCKTM